MRTKPVLAAERLAILTLGVYLAAGGVARLAAEQMTYLNYLHVRMSAASSVAVGLALVTAATVGWRWLSQYL
jgi:divalent metal cation (Fe/Co/Zn/Cd) transporter